MDRSVLAGHISSDLNQILVWRRKQSQKSEYKTLRLESSWADSDSGKCSSGAQRSRSRSDRSCLKRRPPPLHCGSGGGFIHFTRMSDIMQLRLWAEKWAALLTACKPQRESQKEILDNWLPAKQKVMFSFLNVFCLFTHRPKQQCDFIWLNSGQKQEAGHSWSPVWPSKIKRWSNPIRE